MPTDTPDTPTQPSITVACPTCEKPIVWSSQNPFRPFCSERCRLIDLGAWANEEHRIAGTYSDNDIDD